MKGKRKTYTADFKAKAVIELLSGDMTLSQICGKYEVTSKSLLSWKKRFLSNANLAFDIESAVSEYKNLIEEKEKEVNELHRQLGKRTAELEWASKKLKSLDFDQKKQLIKSEQEKSESLSVFQRCEVLGFNRSSFYYQSSPGPLDRMALLRAIDRIYSECPFYGYRKIHQALLSEGFNVGANRVNAYMQELGIRALCPSKNICTTVANIEHHKYPYLLREIEIQSPNQVWSTDITYLRLNGGFVYLAAVIDWYSKAILSWKISNTMDSTLVIDVLKNALESYGTPEIFNTDQGSQYTSKEHTELLAKNGIKISMDGKGRATDNIAIERFWRSAKYENVYLNDYKSIKELKKGMDDYIYFYNNKRFHQTLDYQKPMEVYLGKTEQKIALAA